MATAAVQLLVCADDVNLLGDNNDKKNSMV
jgi:hypothetical protein